MTPRDLQIQCDLAGDPHSTRRAAKAAMQRATWGRTGRIADATGLSQRTIETWGNPSDPQRSPLEQLEIVMFTAIVDGATHDEATAPLAHLNQRFLSPNTDDGPSIGLTFAAADSMREGSEFLASLAEAIRDGVVSDAELAVIEREAADVITITHRIVREAQAANARSKGAGQPMRGVACRRTEMPNMKGAK